MYICICKGITDRDIRAAAADGCSSLRDLKRELGVATVCGRCAACAKDVLHKATNVSICNNRLPAAAAAA